MWCKSFKRRKLTHIHTESLSWDLSIDNEDYCDFFRKLWIVGIVAKVELITQRIYPVNSAKCSREYLISIKKSITNLSFSRKSPLNFEVFIIFEIRKDDKTLIFTDEITTNSNWSIVFKALFLSYRNIDICMSYQREKCNEYTDKDS